MRPLKDALPPAGDKVLYVFYDFETTQNTRYTDAANLHVLNLVYVQQFCSRCEDQGYVVDCVRCGRRKYSFWEDPAGELLSYLTEPHPWANGIVAIAHNANALDLHFILNRAILLKWKPELIMNRLKIMCTRSVRNVSDLWPGKRNWLTLSVGHLITLKVVPLGLHTLLPAVPPLLEACRKSIFRNGV